MKQDIRKLAFWLEKVCQEGVPVEQKVLEWKLSEMKKAASEQESKPS